MATIVDFNKALEQVEEIARELGIKATDAQHGDDDENPTLTVFFHLRESNPLTLDALQN